MKGINKESVAQAKAYHVSGSNGSYMEYELVLSSGVTVEGFIDTVDGESEGEFLGNDINAVADFVNDHPRGTWSDVGVNSLEDFSGYVG